MKYLLTLIIFFAANSAYSAECDDLRSKFREAKENLLQNLDDYKECISSNKGDGDCDAEFSRTNDDQNDFDSAVSDLGQNDCKEEEEKESN